MEIVRRHTTIPVPRALGSFRYLPQSGFSYHDADALGFSGWRDLKDEAKSDLVAQLRDYVLQLRSIPPPIGSLICSVLSGPVYDLRLCSNGRYGPYADEEQMDPQLCLSVRLECTRPEVIESHLRRHLPSHMAISHPGTSWLMAIE